MNHFNRKTIDHIHKYICEKGYKPEMYGDMIIVGEYPYSIRIFITDTYLTSNYKVVHTGNFKITVMTNMALYWNEDVEIANNEYSTYKDAIKAVDQLLELLGLFPNHEQETLDVL